ncbi:succinate dehydrogenase [Paraburkholderia sp. SARCC-3016]|uniref:succinate dehydrogenase n=1 Tax=Paraburkholderia sp. SARCC-3016 TaxID=3058611 RepID=UPI00280A0147|nr:succinate dehydrogenase [Paraburkholderia sp. SARCC-3016]MDQ7978612.1 succinate dehydrogenase [Paraburkholderia sp. SARCC-3016]
MKAAMSGWRVQRISAMVLAVCVTVHLITMIAVVHGGLSAGAILARLHGNVVWGLFYAVFVLAAAAHVPVGLRRIAEEWLRWRGPGVFAVSVLVGLMLAIAGLRAVFALTGGPL